MCDNDLLRLLSEHGGHSISEMAAHFHVSQTAIRNRLIRLTHAGSVTRKCKGERSRGRPRHLYYITSRGEKMKELLDESRSRGRVASS